MQTYDVALWESWSSLWPEYIGLVKAPDAFTAVLLVMHGAGVGFAAKAVVNPGEPPCGPLRRWFNVKCALTEEGEDCL